MTITMSISTSDGEILTIKQVADYLKVTERTIYRLAAAKKIPAFKVGFRFTRDVAQFSGFHKFCENFPYDFIEKKASERESGLSMAYISISKVSDQIQSRVFNRPLAHKAKLDIVKSRLSSFQSQ